MGRHNAAISRAAGLLIGMGVAAGCAQPAPPLTATQPAPSAPPEIEGVFTATPEDLSRLEETAFSRGEMIYGGYACSLGAGVCICETPMVQRAAFRREPGSRMTYHFSGDTYSAEWLMTRIAPGQWAYTLPAGVDEQGGTPGQATGAYFFLLTFTEQGYTLMLRKDDGRGSSITCPEVSFTLLKP